MMPEIYQIQNRGQVVNNACQWIARHRRLAVRVLVLPTLLVPMLLLINYITLQIDVIYILDVVLAMLYLPTLPMIMMHVAEHEEEFGYPERLPRVMQLIPLWWRYFKNIFIVNAVGVVLSGVLSVTVVLPMVINLIMPIAITAKQRDSDKSVLDVMLEGTKMMFSNFGTFIMCEIGIMIISVSMIGAPIAAGYGIVEFLRQFMNINVTRYTDSWLGNDTTVAVCIVFVAICAAFAYHIVMIIFNFFYGHCKEKSEHVALIERINNL